MLPTLYECVLGLFFGIFIAGIACLIDYDVIGVWLNGLLARLGLHSDDDKWHEKSSLDEKPMSHS